MFRGLWRLTWLEIKIFAREPMGLFGSIGIPVLVFLIAGRMAAGSTTPDALSPRGFVRVGLPVLAAILITLSSVTSLVTVIAIYREGGILKRLRATPLRPNTILTAQVLVKLLFTAVTLALLIAAGRRYYPVRLEPPMLNFGLAVLVATWSILSMGFLIASLAPAARFAQPIAAVILYPMIAVSGLFVPIEELPPAMQRIARLQPLSYAVSLLEGIWTGQGWWVHRWDVAALVIVFAACMLLSAKVFRWE